MGDRYLLSIVGCVIEKCVTHHHQRFGALLSALTHPTILCKRYKPKPKPPERRYHWGSKILPKVMKRQGKNKSSPGQMKLPWDDWEVAEEEVIKVAEKFVIANCYDPNSKFLL
jgi:hypothetical protein